MERFVGELLGSMNNSIIANAYDRILKTDCFQCSKRNSFQHFHRTFATHREYYVTESFGIKASFAVCEIILLFG